MLAERSETGFDVFSTTPRFETVAPELAPLVADEMLGTDALRLVSRPPQKGTQVHRPRRLLKNSQSHRAAGIVINSDCDPGTEGPTDTTAPNNHRRSARPLSRRARRGSGSEQSQHDRRPSLAIEVSEMVVP